MERELGDVGTQFEYENEHAKVWQLVSENAPFERTPVPLLSEAR